MNDAVALPFHLHPVPTPAEIALLFPRQTERLRLRGFVPTDVDAVLDYRGKEDVCRFIAADALTPDSAVGFVSGRLAWLQVTATTTTSLLAVELDGQLIGDVMLRMGAAIDRQAEVGWVFNPRFGGKGYATEAAKSLIDLAFRDLNMHRVWADLNSANDASAKVCRRLGMRREANLREESFVKGAWADRTIFAILDSEWRQLRTP